MSWVLAPECETAHPYGEEGWRPTLVGHEHWIDDVPQRPVALVGTLSGMAEEIYRTNVRLGWFDSTRTFGEGIALLHSEVSEMLEAYRDHGMEDATLPCNVGETPKPEGVGSEAADVLIRLLDMCYRHRIDLGEEYVRKMEYNLTRAYRHGGKRL